jgi:hypothetical protein
MPLNVFIGIAVITVGVILLSFALYSLYNSIDLYVDYNKGDQEAGKELIEDMMWNVGLTLGTLGIANSLRPLAKKLTKTRLAKTLGRELTERLAKNMEINDINRLVKGARNAGASDDVIREYAERAGKDGLDWLRLKGALNFTDNELRNLARLGDNLYNYSDEFLSAFKNSGYQDEIIEAVTKYGDDAVEVVTRYGDNAAEVISKYGGDAVEAITRYGDDALRAITNFGDDTVEVISKYGDDAVRAINKHGEDGLTAIYYYGDKLTDLIGKHGDDVVDQVIKYGDNAVEVITKYGDDAVEAITKYGDDAIEVITKYGDDALDAVSRNIEPDLIKRLDDLGIKPSEYDKFRIVGRESAESVAEAVENAKYSRTIVQEMHGFMDDMVSILDDVGMSANRFDDLRPLSADLLSDADKATIKAIRDAIPMPTNQTVMQKVIPQGDIAKYISGEYSQVKGYITRAQDVKQLGNYDDIYNSLRLDYDGSVFKPATDECVGVIKFKTLNASKIDIPYSQAMGGNVVNKPPFTGNGFTAATNGQAIPEFISDNFIKLYDEAELYTITKDGTETLVAIYNENLGRFVDILE